jgi:hypothetical protein
VKHGAPFSIRGSDETRLFAEKPPELDEIQGFGCLEQRTL